MYMSIALRVYVLLWFYWKWIWLLLTYKLQGVNHLPLWVFPAQRERKSARSSRKTYSAIRDSNGVCDGQELASPSPTLLPVLTVLSSSSDLGPHFPAPTPLLQQICSWRQVRTEEMITVLKPAHQSPALGDSPTFLHSKSQSLWLTHRTVHLSPPQGGEGGESAIL